MSVWPGRGRCGGRPCYDMVLTEPGNDNIDDLAPVIDLILAGNAGSVPCAVGLARTGGLDKPDPDSL